jgi:putative oxidoreductase
MSVPITSPSAARHRTLILASWLPRVALAAIFLGAGFAKLAADPAMVELFADIGAGQWLRSFVGGCEVAGGLGVLVPRVAGPAALGLALLMVGATITNVAVLAVSPLLTVALFGLAAGTAWFRRDAMNPFRRRTGPM